ncbi:MAG: amidohydrolase family protein [Nocardiopsaceae bacterium]|nr:amidohydrolase family protein [Nocardiopsaceae bacterium]
MEFPADKKMEIGPGPDPAPHAPARVTVPPGAVDTHAHVVGDALIPERSYTPPPAPARDYLRMLDATGMTYGVLVQVSVHGTDNTLLLETLRANPGRLRGIAVIPPDPPDATLAELRDAGVTGLRLNSLTGGGTGLDQLDRMDRICAELGWHLQFFTSPRDLSPIASRLSRLTVPYVLDHMGDPDVAAGTGSPEWRLIRDLVADGAWVKLSGANRLADPPYVGTIPFARSLVDAAPDRCVYGSDWPHVAFWGPMPNDGDLVDLLADWIPDPATRDAVLAGNAQRLYGFPAVRGRNS